MDSLHVDSDIRGHHVYKNVWTPFVGEVLLMEREDHNGFRVQIEVLTCLVQISAIIPVPLCNS